jgi:hypothetical protein
MKANDRMLEMRPLPDGPDKYSLFRDKIQCVDFFLVYMHPVGCYQGWSQDSNIGGPTHQGTIMASWAVDAMCRQN